MPIYEYKCTTCNHELEALQKVSEPPLSQCPECENQTLQRIISRSSFRLKGGDWYKPTTVMD